MIYITYMTMTLQCPWANPAFKKIQLPNVLLESVSR